MTQPPPLTKMETTMEDMPTAMPMEDGEMETDDVFSFTPPKNFTPPDDYEEGKPFDVVTSVVMKDGMLAIKSLNGVPVDQTEEEPEETETEAEVTEPEEDGGASLMSDLGKMGL